MNIAFTCSTVSINITMMMTLEKTEKATEQHFKFEVIILQQLFIQR